ncbi:MAG: GlsB/YeaQ/YmgE family stress response membrane protein [Acidobacteriaceae bacterium]|nr:GlsB/YeaQ/YmgE family stress response membrane protein [Acidobacteriaceae bacterium]
MFHDIAHLIWVGLVGLVIGALAKLIMPGKDPGGIIITMILGIAGSFLGTWLGGVLHLYSGGGFSFLIWSIIGALIILAIYHLYKRSRK